MRKRRGKKSSEKRRREERGKIGRDEERPKEGEKMDE